MDVYVSSLIPFTFLLLKIFLENARIISQRLLNLILNIAMRQLYQLTEIIESKIHLDN